MNLTTPQFQALLFFAAAKGERTGDVPKKWTRLKLFELGLLTSSTPDADLKEAACDVLRAGGHALLAARWEMRRG